MDFTNKHFQRDQELHLANASTAVLPSASDASSFTNAGSSRYRTFNQYLKSRFGQGVYRVPIDAGFTCPNRDGSRAFGGCTFCDDRGSGAPTINLQLSVAEQLQSGIERLEHRFKVKKFLAYFQAFTNTYAPESVLKQLYDTALEHPDVVGLCIGTRPDCLDDNILDLLEQYHRRTFLWLEIGLQSAFNSTLERVNRGHTAEEFFDAVRRARKRGLNVATHLIFGLPGETEEQMLSTVKQVSDIDLTGIKIHQLCIYKGTVLEQDFKRGELSLLSEDQYIDLVIRALELLPKEMIVMRLVAEGTKEELMAPSWSLEKNRIMKRIVETIEQKDTWQGKHFQAGACDAPLQ